MTKTEKAIAFAERHTERLAKYCHWREQAELIEGNHTPLTEEQIWGDDNDFWGKVDSEWSRHKDEEKQ